jgi:5-formyltetrahydrofolate cyclo-ligase
VAVWFELVVCHAYTEGMHTSSTDYFHYSKAQWRTWAKAHAISAMERRDDASSQVGEVLVHFLLENPPLVRVCVYVATPYELEVLPMLLEDARLTDRQIYLPRIQPEKQLSWHKLPRGASHGSLLEKHPHLDLHQPLVSLPQLEDTPDVVVIPSLMMDAQGIRLGYGGGYYDRQLAAWKNKPLTLGITRESCLLPALPREPHDMPLDGWVTERGLCLQIPERVDGGPVLTHLEV